MRAPWRWRWRRILGLLALWSGVTAVCWYAPILWLAAAGWVVVWARSTTTPLPHRGAPLAGEEAGHRVESKYGGAQVTVTDLSERRSYDVGS